MTSVAEWDLEPVEPERPPDFVGVADETLLRAVRRRDKGAFGELWVRHVTAARSCARAIAPAEAVDEIVSEASLACWEATLRGRGPRTDFRAYLLQAVRSRAVNRANRQAPETPMDPVEINAMIGSVDDDSAAASADSRVADAFYSLCPRYRRALMLHEVEGLPMSAVAAALGTTLNAAYQVVSRARHQLRALFQDYTGDPDVLGPAEPEEARPGVVPSEELTPKSCPSHVGRALIGGVIGVSVGTFMAEGKAQAFGGIEQIVQPTGMPPLPAPPTTPWVKTVAGGTSAAVVVALATLLLGSHSAVSSDTQPLVILPSATPTPTVVSPSTVPSPTPIATQESPVVVTSSTVVTVTPTPAATTSAAPSPPPPTKTTPPPVPPISVGGVDTGPANVCYPALTGRAAPGSTLQITKWDGTLLGTTTADGSGSWSSGRLGGIRAGTTDIFVFDPTGSQPEASTSVTVNGVAGLGVSHAPSGLSVWVRGGIAGVPLVVTLDGAPVGTIDFDATGEARVVFDVTATPGEHTVTVYYDASSCRGPGLSVPVQW